MEVLYLFFSIIKYLFISITSIIIFLILKEIHKRYRWITLPKIDGQTDFAVIKDLNNEEDKEDESEETYIYDCIIIGAGPAGLGLGGSLRLLDEKEKRIYEIKTKKKYKKKLKFLIIEKENTVAYTWTQHYDRLHLHTSKFNSSLPGIDYPDYIPKFPSRIQVCQYMKSYAILMDLPIIYNTSVINCTYNNNEKIWTVITEKDNQQEVYKTRSLVMATGANRAAFTPKFDNIESYKGRIIHSSNYKNSSIFTDKESICVVGFGNSASEIIIDLVENHKNVTSLIRSPINIVPRKNADKSATLLNYLGVHLPAKLLDFLSKPVLEKNGKRVQHLGIVSPSPHGIMEVKEILKKAPIIDIGQIDLLKDKKVKLILKPIHSFSPTGFYIEENEDINNNNENLKHCEFDNIILATGYRPDFKTLLEKDVVEKIVDDRFKAYPTIFATESQQENLYFVGFRDTFGRLLEINLECPKIAKEIVEKTKLD